jgi:cytochrome c biogenesis protein CcdA
MELTLPLIITTGFLDSINPCAISLLLLYIALMYSMKKTHKTIMIFGFFYIAAIYITYFFIGLGLLRTLHLFNFPGLFASIGAWISIIFGLLNLNEYFFPNSPLKIRMPLSVRAKASEWAHKSTIPSAIVLGFLVGVSEFPCSGAVYLAILGYLRANETLLNGVLYLLIYNLMFVLPLILVYLVATNRVVTERMINFQEKSGRKMHLVLAGVMIALGVIILFIS